MIQKIDHFNIAQIAASGQCFRLRILRENTWSVIARDRFVRVRVLETNINGSQTCDFDCDEKDFADFWQYYFDLDTDYEKIDSLADPEDSYLREAISYGRGIRILRQDMWETIISFLISQRKSIPAITRCIERLCRAYGKKIDRVNYAFPEPEALFGITSEDLSEIGLGYRSRYVSATCRLISEELWNLNAAADPSLTDAQVVEHLCLLPGVGPKIANCVSLFGLHRLSAFPRDIWISRVEKEHYDGKFPEEKYPGYAGVMQQYMFFYERKPEINSQVLTNSSKCGTS